MKEKNSIEIRQIPTGVQEIVAKENCLCLKDFGGKFDAFLWDINGINVHAIKIELSVISEALLIKVNAPALEEIQLEAIKKNYN